MQDSRLSIALRGASHILFLAGTKRATKWLEYSDDICNPTFLRDIPLGVTLLAFSASLLKRIQCNKSLAPFPTAALILWHSTTATATLPRTFVDNLYFLEMSSRCSACGAVVISTVKLTPMTDPQTLTCLEPLSITNEPPRKHESALIRHFVEKTSTCLASLDAEISEVKDRLQQLKEQRIALSGLHARSKKILAPQRRIPPEILGEIFAWTLA
ncbi:hypothetical protein C8R45DRAFT_1109311 [Mycena sanguinolenta]|nr:hypothetical protein C8R45DRAFT_1109311 [Mycena sanguinolenta]